MSFSAPARVIVGLRFDRPINQAKRLARCHCRPGAGLSVCIGGIFLPRLIAVFTLLWNRMEDPRPLAGPYIVPANILFPVISSVRGGPLSTRSTDHDRVLGNHDRRVQADV